MAFTMIRVSAVLLVAMLATPSTPAAAQGLNKTDAHDFQMFRHSIAVRHNARVCERGVPGYGKTFDGLYEKWTEKHRTEITRGESLFKEALNTRDPKRYPYIDRVTIRKVEEGLDELTRPPQATGPTPPAAQTTAACEKLLTFLKEE
jgi:hypothetical protein